MVKGQMSSQPAPSTWSVSQSTEGTDPPAASWLLQMAGSEGQLAERASLSKLGGALS